MNERIRLEVIRMSYGGASQRRIARALGLARKTVAKDSKTTRASKDRNRCPKDDATSSTPRPLRRNHGRAARTLF